MKLEVGLIGIGQAGSNVCEIANIHNYHTAIINTSQEDLDSIKIINKKLKVGKSGGAGKDRVLAKNDVKDSYREIIRFVKDDFEVEAYDMNYVVFSAGGGTGSGMGPIVIDVLRKSIPGVNFGAIVMLPAKEESIIAQVNAVECLKELVRLDIPYFVADNEKGLMNGKISKRDLIDNVNNEIIDSLNSLISQERTPSKYGNLDKRDATKVLLTPGRTMITKAYLRDDAEGISIQDSIIRSLNKSVWCSPEYDGIAKRMGFIFQISDKLASDISFSKIEAEVGKPLEIFDGYSKHTDGRQEILSIISGLSLPDGRIHEMNEIIESNRSSLEKTKEYQNVIEDNNSWFNDLRDETVVSSTSSEPASFDDLNDLFNNY